MCRTHNPRKIDKCMRTLIANLDNRLRGAMVIASCCGHGKYNASLVVQEYFPKAKEKFQVYEWFSGKHIPRKKRFYVKDKHGYYYIPEVIKNV